MTLTKTLISFPYYNVPEGNVMTMPPSEMLLLHPQTIISSQNIFFQKDIKNVHDHNL